MNPKRGFFQPLGAAGQLSWGWWLIVTMLGGIAYMETNFRTSLFRLVVTLIVLCVPLLFIFRRRAYVAGTTLFLGKVIATSYHPIPLDQVNQYAIKGHKLTLIRGQRRDTFWLNRQLITQINEVMTTHDNTN